MIVLVEQDQSDINQSKQPISLDSDISVPDNQIKAQSQNPIVYNNSIMIFIYPLINMIMITVVLIIADYTGFDKFFLMRNPEGSCQLRKNYRFCLSVYQYFSHQNINEYHCLLYSNSESMTLRCPLLGKAEPLFIASFATSAILYIIIYSQKKTCIKFFINFVYFIVEIFSTVGFCLLGQYAFSKWIVWSCLILISSTYILMMILKKIGVTNSNIIKVIVIFPQITLLCYGVCGFQIESVGIAILFSLNALYSSKLITQNNSFLNSIQISGIFMHYIIASINLLIVNSIQTIISFNSKAQLKEIVQQNAQKKIHLIEAYTIILVVLTVSLIVNAVLIHSNYFQIFAIFSKEYTSGNISFIFNSLSMTTFIIVPFSHLIAILLYIKYQYNKIIYLIAQILLKLEILFIPIFIGAITLKLASTGLVDSKCLEYCLFFTGLGVLCLLANQIANDATDENSQLYLVALPLSALIMIVYQSNYYSITLGLITGILFTLHINCYSNKLLNNEIFQIHFEDQLVTALCCLNPIQIFNHLIIQLVKNNQNQKVILSG